MTSVARPALIGGLVVGAALLAGCDSASGIPGDGPEATAAVTTITPPAAIPTQTTPLAPVAAR
ncbi:hypothetical protein GV794_17870, partial [Nocardia cyriacigeorgica]|nr:hypothetical protein [Nocardia cyriacigeorgica]